MILGTWRVEYSFLTLPKAYREIKSYLGYFPIFCFRFDDAKTAILHSLMIEPNQGQELVVFEPDDFVKIDIVKWAQYVSAMVQKKKDGIKLEECFEIEDDKYCAYIVKDIENPVGKMFLKDMVFNEYKIDKNNPLKFAGKMDYEMYLKALFDEMTELLKSIFGEEWYENKEINPENVIIIKENALLCMAPFIYSGILNMDIGSAPLLMLDGYFSSKCFDKRLEFFNYEKDIEAKTHEAFDEIYKGIEGFFGNSLNSVYIKTSGIKVGRNDPCPCGSGKKYKKCCGR